MLRLLMVSTSYPSTETDWKGRFIKDLVSALSVREDIELQLWAPPGDIPDNIRFAPTEREHRWLRNLADRGGIAQALRDGGIRSMTSAGGLLLHLWSLYRRVRDIDLVHVNWLHNALPLAGTKLPAVVSVLGTDFGLLDNAPLTRALAHVLGNRQCIVAPNAGWMTEVVAQRLRGVVPVAAVPFGVDEHWFRVGRSFLADDKRLWLVVSRVTRKKIGPLFDWLGPLVSERDEIHLFGPQQEPVHIPSWVTYHGPTYPSELLEKWFPKAAGLVTLSRHDEGRPQVILEAMAAGLPVVASDLPAHLDVIRHGVTGWIVKNSDDLQQGLERLRDPAYNSAISSAAKRWVTENVGTWRDCADRYVALYRRVLGLG